MSKVLTIAVAVYNIEKYLDQCLASFADERLKDDLEVLIINDGSKDSSQSIAEKYVEKYPSIFKLINKENGGYGTTFPVGFSNATGKYYKVVDGDDYVDTDALCTFVDKLKKIDSDIVITSYTRFDDKDMLNTKLCKFDIGSLQYDKEYSFSDVTGNIKHWFICNLVYKTSLITDNNISVGKKYYVDMEYVLYPVFYAKTITFVDLSITQYRDNQNSNSTANLSKHADEILVVGKKILSFYYENKVKIAEVDEYVCKTIADLISTCYFAVLLMPFSKRLLHEVTCLNKLIRGTSLNIIKKAGFPMKCLFYFSISVYPMSILAKMKK